MLIPTLIKRFFGINDSQSPIIKNPEFCDVADNFELSRDFALTTRKGTLLFDRASRLREFNNFAFVADEFLDSAGNQEAGTKYYIGRYYDPIGLVYSLPTRTVECIIAGANATVLVQVNLVNNPDRTVFTKFVLYRTIAGADPTTDNFYRVETFDEAAGEAFINYLDTTSDAAIVGNPSVNLGASGLNVDRPVVAIVDFKRRLGGNDVLMVAGPYIKSLEIGDKIYEDLTTDILGSWVVFQNAVFYVNGVDNLVITDGHVVFTMSGDPPNQAPSVTRISGPLQNVYRWVYTFYDSGFSTGHPWESNPSDISASLNLTDGGAHVVFNDTNAPSRATHRKLYRTLSDGEIETALLVDTIPIADTDYFDTNVDAVIGPDVVPFDTNDPVQDLKLKFIFPRNDRLYGAGNIDSPSDIYWSQRGGPEQWSELYNRLPLGENDGDEVCGFGEVDGKLVVFKKNSIYVIPDDPPNQVYRLGFEQGAINFRAVVPGDNGLYCVAENSVYKLQSDSMEDLADYIGSFIQFYTDPTISTLKMGQIASYTLPTKKQIIVLFKTMDSGFVNSVAKVYHPKIARAVQNLSAGWTTFNNFKATTLQVIKDTFNRATLLLGGEDGNVYIHERVAGQDRAYYENFGANGAPFIGTQAVVGDIDALEPWTDLNDWLVTGAGLVEINPAGILHVLDTAAQTNLIAFIGDPTELSTGIRVLMQDVTFTTIPAGDTGAGGALIVDVAIKTSDESATARTRVRLGVFGNGVYGDDYDGIGFVKLLDFTFAPATPYDIEFKIAPGNATAEQHMRVASVSINGVWYALGVVWGQATTTGTRNSLAYRTRGYAGTTLDFTMSSSYVYALGADMYGAIERFYDGTPIQYVYESPWISLDDFDDVQKFVQQLYLVCKANFNEDINVTIYSDFIEADGVVTAMPVNGGTLFDIGTWDQAIWDGLKQTVGNRGNTNSIGNRFKVKVDFSFLGAYFEFYGLTVRRHEKEADLITARADEGQSE